MMNLRTERHCAYAPSCPSFHSLQGLLPCCQDAECVLCRRLTRSSLPEIATQFEKTHATVLHACKAIRGRMETDPDLNARVQSVARRLGRDPMVVLKD